MNILLTFDYELFFGDSSGSVEKCMLQPTEDLLAIARGNEVVYTFFVDVGYLIASKKYPELDAEREHIEAQIQLMVKEGHSVQLHVHPHWEKAEWKEGQWHSNTSGNYKLSDFSEEEAHSIIEKYKQVLELITGKTIFAFRAGGWCIQPFSHIQNAFRASGLSVDSSVIPGGFLMTDDYHVDFTNAPRKSRYNFQKDVCIEVENGDFTEFPISSLRYSPLFFWKLYILGRLLPAKHKMIGDGKFLSQGGRKRSVLTTYTDYHVSTDGYYASKLSSGLQKSINLKFNEMVVIGHPKGNTSYSLSKLKNFIELNQNNHCFTTFPDK